MSQDNPDSLVTEPIGCGRCDPYTAHLLGDAGLYGETCADIGCKERTWRLLPDQPIPENTATPGYPSVTDDDKIAGAVITGRPDRSGRAPGTGRDESPDSDEPVTAPAPYPSVTHDDGEP